MDNFCHLHCHGTYSFQDGLGHPKQYVARAKEIGQTCLAITDHGNVSSAYKHYKECKKENIKPILGVEMYLVDKTDQIYEKAYSHIVVLVKNNEGYKNLMKLVTKSWCEQFYYKPRITYEDLFKYQKGLIVLSGCLSSPFMKLLQENKDKEAFDLFTYFKEKIDDFYVEFQPIGFSGGVSAYKKLLTMYEERLKPLGFKMVVTNDCHYVCKEHAKTQEVLLCIQSRDKMSNPKHWKFDQNDFYLKSRKEMQESLNAIHPDYDFTDALNETMRIAELVDFTFPKAEPIRFDMPDEEKKSFIKQMCYDGMKNRKLVDGQFEYTKRLERELGLIIKKDFVDYFLVIADLVNWAKKEGILVGPARGSAAGSLACYVLGITEVEPLMYGLIFERFIDINRADLPDIDIDFEDSRRHEVKEYLEKKYGRDKVGSLPTVAVFKGKSALQDIGRVFEIPFKVIDQVKNAIVERSGGDSRASFTLIDTFNSDVFTYPKEAMQKYPELHQAVELEGQLRQLGQHAAGVVISNEPITDFCALYKIKDNLVTSLDYKDITDIGLLKIDVLGLNTLSVVSETLRQIKKRHGKVIDIYTLPLDNKETYKGFRDGKLFGIFQFDGQAMNQVCRQVKPKEFRDLSAVTALARPGCLNSGNTTEYILRRDKKSPVTYIHPAMKDITGDTLGIVIYQEQVMRVMREIGNMSWEDTSSIRKMMSRSLGVEAFNAYKDRFMPGAIENGLDNKVAEKIWDQMCEYGSWGMNKSHTVSYSIISYWTMWLKIHYPIEFYGSILALTDLDEKKKKILKEYKREGYKVLGVHINKSERSFSIDEGGLMIGFEDIQGIGPGLAHSLIKNQPYSSYTDCMRKMHNKRFSENSKKHLVDLGAFDEIKQEDQKNIFGESVPEFTKNEIPFSERFELCPWDMEFNISDTWIPFLKKYPQTFKEMPIPIDNLEHMKTGFKEPAVVIWGVVYDKNLRDVREVSASKGKEIDISKYNGQFQFANFILEDASDFVTIRLSAKLFPKYGNTIMEKTRTGDVVMIRGKMGNGIRMFFANKILNLRIFKEQNEPQ